MPMAPRQGPLWLVSRQSTLPVPGIERASMNVAGLSTRLPKNPAREVPSGWMVQRLWIGMAGLSTYSQRE